jgi:hypothetical protein
MTPAELATWLREHPDAVVFWCGCIWTAPHIATILQTPQMDCPKHHPAQFRPGLFLPFKP